jgi:hypothetical protein
MSGIRRIGFDDLLGMLDAWQPSRRIDAFHVHHTWRPRHRDFRGASSIEAMRRYHMREMGMRDIAQHLTIDPAGGLWTGRAFDMPPGSARGHNGTDARGPFMVEMVGDFDLGQDRFEGEQKRIAHAVAAVLHKFGLEAAAVRFHREFSSKTCPGSGIDLDAFRTEVGALLRAGVPARPRVSDARLTAAQTRAWAAAARGGDGGDPQAAALEASGAEPPEDEAAGHVMDYIADGLERGLEPAEADDGARAGGPAPFDTAALLPYVLNLSRGLLSGEGRISSADDDSAAGDGGFACTRSSLRAIVERHLPAYIAQCRAAGRTPRLLFYVHGGLVREKAALGYAKAMAPWWLAHGVYPIFFIWESGLLETVLPSWATHRGAPVAARGFLDTPLEWSTQLLARRVWARMKQHAEDGSLERIPGQDGKPGGGWLFAELLKPLLAATPELELHAVGHSTGPILLSRFMPLLMGAGHSFRTMSYLAPAIRTDVFTRRVLPTLRADPRSPGIRELTMYTMTDAAERRDNVAVGYRKSLLYYVRNACEDDTDGRVLGLACDLAADPNLRTVFGVVGASPSTLSCRSADGRIGVEFSPPHDSGLRNPLTSAVRHGCFDNNADTLFAILGRVLGAPVAETVTAVEHQFPGGSDFVECSAWGMPDDDRQDMRAMVGDASGGCPCCCCGGGGPAMPPVPARFGDDAMPDEDDAGGHGDAGQADAGQGDAGHGTGDASDAGRTGGGRQSGRRRALCIGIDAYGRQPLSGCVADSQRWERVLRAQGFEVRRIADAEATRAGMLQGLRALIADARAGDELVFQYAGHGSQVEDLSRDEDDRLDEVFLPFDFDSGALLIDDDFHAETLRLPQGVHLTLFMDCCHSGSDSRVASVPRPRGDARPRYLRLSAAEVERYRRARGSMGVRAARGRSGEAERAPPRVIHFGACQDHEFAWESDGHGDFTRIATGLLARARREGWDNARFMQGVVAGFDQAFDGRPRQRPQLLPPAEGLEARRLLGAS